MIFLGALALLATTGLAARLWQLTVVDGVELRQEAEQRLDRTVWLSTVRGKLGIASEESFVYLTGGLAMSNVTSTVTNLSGADSFDLSEEADMTGWTVGAGMNFKVAENVDMGIEYLYVDLGEGEYDYEWPIEVTGGAEGDLTMHVVRASINYHF